ncbi:nucleotidyltransferase [soil metagenome]
MSLQLQVDREKLERLCARYRVERLAFFGSVLGEDFGSASDVDVLVEFERGHTPGLSFVRLQRELSAVIDRRVDLHTYHSLSRYFRDQVRQQSEVVYERAPQAS